ncbi:MAG: hypothetical protein J7J11_00980 [Desulfurococcales archaeon]|nr:hypothetical protein [Desulfurococcales archaeon]
MSSRVVGHGTCPKCGRSGSLVLKKLGGNVYIYFKHGSRWCYIGPVGSVDMDELLRDVELEPYHNFTTKFTEYLSKLLDEARLRLGAQLMIGLALTVSAYGLATGGAKYSSIILTLAGLSALLFASLLATYESGLAKEFATRC